MAHDRLTSMLENGESSHVRPRRYVHRLSNAMGETESADVGTLEAQRGTVAPERPANTHRRQSFLHVTAPEEDFDTTATSTSSRLSMTRRKQSFLHVTAARASQDADDADDGRSRIRAQSSASPHQPSRSVADPMGEHLQAGDSNGSEFATAVQGTLGMIREHREYLDQSRAAARRTEDILARLADTPTASWRAKQKPSVVPVTGAANAKGTRLPRPVASSGMPTRSSNVARPRAGTALADRIVTNVNSARGSLEGISNGISTRRRSASIDSIARSSAGVPESLHSPATAAPARDLGRRLLQKSPAVDLPRADSTKPARLTSTNERASLPRAKERPALRTAVEARRADRILLDSTMPAFPAPPSSAANRAQPHVARTATRQPLQVAQTSSAQTRTKSTFPRTVRPDPFAPKSEINTRPSGVSGARQSRPLSSVSIASRSAALSQAPDSRPQSFVSAHSNAGQSIPRRPTSDVPAWQRLSQQSTVSWSSKGKAPKRDEDHIRELQAMVANRPVSIPSSLQPPSNARISWVGEDFDMGMEGSVDDRKLQARLRQDSGGDADLNGDPNTAAQNQQSALVSSLDLSTPKKYDKVVTTWHDDAGWLFSITDQNCPKGYEALTGPLRSVEARRSSSKLDMEFPDAESFQAMVDRAHKSMGKPRSSTIAGIDGTDIPSASSLSRARRDSTSFMTRTKNFFMAPFRLGNKIKVSGPIERPRRGSTGSLLPPRPAIVHHMANGTQVTYSHANSLRPEHNPALLRTTVSGGQPQTARLPKRRSAQPRVRSSLATHEERAEDEEEERPSWIDMNVHELPADDVKPEMLESARRKMRM